jgi:hypothetical protein
MVLALSELVSVEASACRGAAPALWDFVRRHRKLGATRRGSESSVFSV